MTFVISNACICSLDGASLKAINPDIMHITSCRSVIRASAVFVACCLFLSFRKGGILYGLVKNI